MVIEIGMRGVEVELLLNWESDGDDEVDVRCLSVNLAKALVVGSAPPLCLSCFRTKQLHLPGCKLLRYATLPC